MFLKWTPRGAVVAPDTLQIRLSPTFAARVAAGAPAPGRSMSDDEIDANVRFFATPGPRGRPISGLVFSGVDRDLRARIGLARSLSVRRVVVHAEPGQARDVSGADTVAVAVRSVVDAELVRGVPAVHAVVPLAADVLPVLGEIVGALDAERVTLTWPFPGGAQPSAPPVGQVLAALPEGNDRRWEVKGLPRCVVGELPLRISRTSNRWYVDADHQLQGALLFLPDVLQLAKREACRFCTEDPDCDGVAERWLLLGLAGPLVPLKRGVRSTG